MCYSEAFGAELPSINVFYNEIKEVISSLECVFWINGVALPIILCAGFGMNIGCLIMIRFKGLKAQGESSTHRLLQGLVVCDLLIMVLSVYSDVEPAIRARVSLDKIRDTILGDCEAVINLRATIESYKDNNGRAFEIGAN
ncbi:hypothetical protein RRG08_049672 [Elysia crispata]|uniref:Uncharacterized protein n=1 Tax=Elysia crispata TaxID=231223 RepID=A0AAE1CT98_9GAST|nr:hypothetical protein RRG08_049672 [Elysia crispata]